MRPIAIAVIALALTGCAAQKPIRSVDFGAFPVAEYEALPKTGNAIVIGRFSSRLAAATSSSAPAVRSS